MTAILEFKDVSYSYPNHAEAALKKLTIELPSNTRVTILGRNGSGKSTFLRHCNGTFKPKSGTVYFDGQPIAYDYHFLRLLRNRVGVVFQNADEQMLGTIVEEELSFGAFNQGWDEDKVYKRVRKAAKLCEIMPLLNQASHELSGGEKARVALAKVLVMEPDVLLIDEPTANLDPWMRRKLFAIFERLYKEGHSIILATHEVEIALYWADFVIIIEDGQVLAVDTSKKIFANRALMEQLDLTVPWYLRLRSKA
jgi:cobalt/nickel transport system ATP-binding protein